MERAFYCLFLIIAIHSACYASDSILHKTLEKNLHNTQQWRNLLHYVGDKSSVDKNSDFFISSNGYKDPEQELIATITAFSNNIIDDMHVFCKYPARTEYILNASSYDIADIDMSGCKLFNEFQHKISAEKVYISFAAENTMSPSSMMGHMFIKFIGRADSIEREHSFSYSAVMSSNPIDYLNAFTGMLDGYYILEPYRNKLDYYIDNENRVVWEFELSLSGEEIDRLLKHVWELKEKKVIYNFVTHNCGNAAIQLLKNADPEIITSNKLFHTPIDYLQMLNKNGKLISVTVIPTDDYLKKIQKYGIKNILLTPKPSKINLHYLYRYYSFIGISFMPVYMDITEPLKDAHFEHLEAKILFLDFRYKIETNDFFINKLDILALKSIADASAEFVLSKDLRISLENSLDRVTTNLNPTVEFGLGYAYSLFEDFTLYSMPKIGYRYDNIHNFYMVIELGIFYEPLNEINLSSVFLYYIDINHDNRGYNTKVTNSAVWYFHENYGLSAIYIYYKNTEQKNINEVSIGFTYLF